jgi:flavorubredoxin
MNTPTIEEVRPGLYRTSTYVEKLNLSFNQFFIRSDNDTLICVESGMREHFPAMAQCLLDAGLAPSSITSFIAPHFEADEMGALPELLAANPKLIAYAHPMCAHGMADVFGARTKALRDGERVTLAGIEVVPVFATHVHQWDSLVVYLPAWRTLLSSDLFMRYGTCAATQDDPVPGIIQSIERSGFLPSLAHFALALEKLRNLDIELILPMHGPAIEGDVPRVIAQLLDYCRSPSCTA